MSNPEHLAKLKEGVKAWNQWREDNPDITPDLKSADLRNADLTGANLFEANLFEANLESADLRDANLASASLHFTNFNATDLSQANLKEANIYETNFADLDLSQTKGLDSLRSGGECSVDHRTLMRSKNLPEKFLRDCGFPQQFIENLPSLLSSLDPIQFYLASSVIQARTKSLLNDYTPI
jgi:hypothetical protein